MKHIRIATRKSPLALWQAEDVKARLQAAHPGLEVELVTMVTKGDKILDVPLAKVGGKGLFVKELEQALIDGRADIAVHSMKDVPMEFPQGLGLSVVLERDSPFDAFVSGKYENIDALPQGAVLGTSSLRRSAQVLAHRPDLKIVSLRGNVGSRLQKLDDGQFDAIILAAAGLNRLEKKSRIRSLLDEEICLPACGQGAVGIECRANDVETQAALACLSDSKTTYCVMAERAMNTHLEGGCQVPIAGYAVLEGDELFLRGRVASCDGMQVLKAEARGSRSDASAIGVKVAEQLLDAGADKILAEVYAENNV